MTDRFNQTNSSPFIVPLPVLNSSVSMPRRWSIDVKSLGSDTKSQR